jgi:DNA polymerase III gamma/tau subunit
MTTHHAVLYCADEPLSCVLDEPFHTLPENEYRLTQFGIDDARRLIAAAHRRPDGENASKTLLIATEFITEEAQQALLKVIEEPPVSTKFVFVVPNGYTLLATLESRFDRAGELSKAKKEAVFREFKSAGVKTRLELIEGWTKNKDHASLNGIKRGLVTYLKAVPRDELSTENQKDLEYVSRLLLTRGASNKMLMEHLALNLPA